MMPIEERCNSLSERCLKCVWKISFEVFSPTLGINAVHDSQPELACRILEARVRHRQTWCYPQFSQSRKMAKNLIHQTFTHIIVRHAHNFRPWSGGTDTNYARSPQHRDLLEAKRKQHTQSHLIAKRNLKIKHKTELFNAHCKACAKIKYFHRENGASRIFGALIDSTDSTGERKS
jgi:hypothetical protein